MNKEQIEEMAKIYCKTEFLCNKGCQTEGCRIYEICDTLYNAEYRKVPDGATVLLVGKYNQALDEKTIEYFIKHNEQIRKETAREILQCLYDKCYETQNSRGGFAHITPLDILVLAKHYGVEVKE